MLQRIEIGPAALVGGALLLNLTVADMAIKVAGVRFRRWEWPLVLLTIGWWPAGRFCKQLLVSGPDNRRKIWDALTLLVTGNSTKAAFAIVPTLYSLIYLLDGSESHVPRWSELFMVRIATKDFNISYSCIKLLRIR